jgi:hypothetical protein
MPVLDENDSRLTAALRTSIDADTIVYDGRFAYLNICA